MPPPTTMKSYKRGQEEKTKRGKMVKKASSFHGRSIDGTMGENQEVLLRRPRTVPDLLAGKHVAGVSGSSPEVRLKLTKLLLNVTVQRSLGAVHVVMSQEATVEELIAAALRQYVKEGRRPVLVSIAPEGFDLHYSQFSLESVEVKPGQTLEVKPEYNKLIHVSQAALDEVKNNNGANFVTLRLKVNTKEFVIGSLSAGERRQLMLDLVFEKNFVLSHDWKNGSVFFCGYTAENPDSDGYSTEDEDGLDDDEEYPLDSLENGKLEPKVEKMKPAKNKATGVKSESSAKPTVTFAEPKKNEERKEEEGSESDDDDDDYDEEEDSSEAEEDSSDVPEEMDDSDDSDQIPTEDDSDDDDEHTPKKADLGTKRSFESVTKTPVPAKKAKSPQKTATPHPSKQAGKTSANSSKAKERIPKSTVKVSRKSCSKTFGSEKALELHTMGKHSGA